MSENINDLNLLKKIFRVLKREGWIKCFIRIAKYPFNRYILKRKEKKIFSHQSIGDRFTEIYKLNYWNSKESVSGTGSSMHVTQNLRKNLPLLFKKFNIASIFDAPCGDFNWMKHVIKEYPLNYIGGDIVLPLINSHQKFSNQNIKFIHIDLTKQKFPTADLMICRDCLFHLSYNDIKLVIKNFIDSDISFLLTTTHINKNKFLNKDIETGSFRLIDLFSPPFNFPKAVLFRIPDWELPEEEREMCLWSKEQIISAFLD